VLVIGLGAAMTTDLAVIEAALKAATPGPWSGWDAWGMNDHTACHRIGTDDYSRGLWASLGADIHGYRADMELVIQAPAWLAELVERVKAAEAEVERLEVVARKINRQLFDAGYHEAELMAENRAMAATIQRVQQVARNWSGHVGVTLCGEPVKKFIDALNGPEAALGAPSSPKPELGDAPRAESATEPLAVDHEGGCCR